MGGRRKEKGQAGIEARRALVAERLLARKSVREIAAELMALPKRRRPADCSPATVGRDVQALRAAWQAARAGQVEAMVAQELARLDALDAVWWPLAVATAEPAGAIGPDGAGKGQAAKGSRAGGLEGATPAVAALATDKVLAIQRQRMGLLGVGVGGGRGRVVVAAGQKGQEVEQATVITVEWVDDWRDGVVMGPQIGPHPRHPQMGNPASPAGRGGEADGEGGVEG